MRRFISASLIVIVSMGATQSPPNALEREAMRQVGQVATFCGVVVAYGCHGSLRTSLLALDKFEQDSVNVSIAIDYQDRSKFGLRFEPRHVLRDVCATGRVGRAEGNYVIQVTEPSHIKVQGTSVPAMSFGADSVSACDVGVSMPKVVKRVEPSYPRRLRASGVQGFVLLEGLVLTNGRVGDVRVVRSLGPRLDTEATKALKAYRWEPGTLDGKAVPVVVTVGMTFRLEPSR